ncbi:DEAD/DEAH box helicase [Aridibaculum aurantiacum]|uniref:DEAD/DEAH box helicase n=1 Tax=Aridibaculum aurantiacum TaxID=2810307 RepID=UPI001A970DE2|nr:DEAD/DEAH box helicase [Aridibaculum aurantiacum]
MATPSTDIQSILERLKIKELNEMQQASLQANEAHNDVVLLSPTGSGKTLAFLLPIVQQLDASKRATQALIVVPSRELALQIEQVFKSMQTPHKVTCCYGGHKREIEENNLIEAPAVIIGTPGRLGDHIRRENIKTAEIKTLVLDEYDKSLELGFVEEITFIIESLPALEKRMLTSATQAVDIPEFVGMKEPVELNFLPADAEPGNALAIQMVQTDDEKEVTLFRLICYLCNRSTIIFCNHREAVEETSAMLRDKGIMNTWYHGALEQRDREVALAKFRNGSVNVLVTTDLAARGLDIPNIRYIVHYHLPSSEEIFTHRNGRTARMEASGTAILVLGSDEYVPPYIKEIETIELPSTAEIPEKPKWTTLFVGAGKKDKVNKIDIVGFLGNKGGLKKEDIGLIEVKDFFSFVAVRKSKVPTTLQSIKNEKIKNKKVKIDVAK